jgi:hypothetical protein
MRSSFPVALVPLALAACATSSRPAGPAIPDAETRAWWAVTTELSNDAMEGRDTGSPAYDRAAALVADHWRRAGLRPAGDNGTWFQPIALREVAVESVGTRFTVIQPGGHDWGLRFLHDLTIRPTASLPASIDAPLAFRGYCSPGELGDVRGKAAICFNTRRPGMVTAGERLQAVAAAGAAALIQIDDPGFVAEPPRWPAAYARAVDPVGTPPPAAAALPVIRYNPGSLDALVEHSGARAGDILSAGMYGLPLPAFDPPGRLRATLAVRTRDLSSPNVLGILPGTDPALAGQYVVVGAHLDGYGHGEPVDGDDLYNGTFDDAAYVATLIRLAEQRGGRGFRRPILFAAFTGEEKGLIGSRWLVGHLPVPREQIAAMINLDQLRPIFPLDLLTVHGLEDSTVGQDARAVAEAMGIRVRLDPQPERNLIRRTDHWPFLMADVPAVNFVFGFEPGSEAERIYLLWYQTRYHSPADDLDQPWDPVAAERFNRFFYNLVERVADADRRPAFLGTNPYRGR